MALHAAEAGLHCSMGIQGSNWLQPQGCRLCRAGIALQASETVERNLFATDGEELWHQVFLSYIIFILKALNNGLAWFPFSNLASHCTLRYYYKIVNERNRSSRQWLVWGPASSQVCGCDIWVVYIATRKMLIVILMQVAVISSTITALLAIGGGIHVGGRGGGVNVIQNSTSYETRLNNLEQEVKTH